MAFPGTKVAHTKDLDAIPIRRELGKGQEVLRNSGTVKVTLPATATHVRALVMVPDVDIKLTGVKVIGTGVIGASNAINVLAPATYAAAAGATNRLITELATADVPDDTLVHAVLTALANRVVAGQPIVLDVLSTVTTGAGTVEVQVSYVLADDDQLTY